MRLTKRHAAIAIALLSTLFVHAARSEITPQAREVVERYAEVTGGRAARDSVRTIRTRGRAVGFEVAADRTSYAALPWRTASELADDTGYRILEGYDGTTFWRRTPRGGFTHRAGVDLIFQEGQSYFENQQWLSSDQGGGLLEVTGTGTDSAGECTIVEATPPVGPPRRLWFNARTGLLDREILTMNGVTTSREFSDYRRVGTTMWPFRIEFRGAKADFVLDLDSLFVNEPIAASRFELPPSDPLARTGWPDSTHCASLPFRIALDHLWLDASFNGRPSAKVILATGAAASALDSAYAVGIGLTTHGLIQMQAIDGPFDAAVARVDSIRIEVPGGRGIVIGKLEVAVLPLLTRSGAGSECVGVLGADVLSRFVTEIDFDQLTVTLHDPRTFAYSGQGTPLPFTPVGYLFGVPVTLDGVRAGRFGVAIGLGVTARLDGRLAAERGLPSRAGRAFTLGGGVAGTVSRLDQIEVGPYELAGPLVWSGNAPTGPLSSWDYGGDIGYEFLKRFKCTFDYSRRRLYLEPGRGYAEPDRFSRAGVWFAIEAGRIMVTAVGGGTPGERAGLSVGDIVTSIDGRTAGSWTPADLDLLLERGEIGRRVTIEFLRDGVKRKATLTLAEIL